MDFYRRLVISLALCAGVAAALLAITYSITSPVIQVREKEERAKALMNVFFLGEFGEGGMVLREIADGVTALYDPAAPDTPAYYAAQGEAVGYNSSSPVSLMVGFTGSDRDARDLLDGYVDEKGLPGPGDRGHYIVGFSVVSSEETPGLGERIKDRKPPFTWAQYLAGNAPPPDPDKATRFQRQFRGRLPGDLLLKKHGGDLDAITASTITSTAVTAAIRNAGEKLDQALRGNLAMADSAR